MLGILAQAPELCLTPARLDQCPVSFLRTMTVSPVKNFSLSYPSKLPETPSTLRLKPGLSRLLPLAIGNSPMMHQSDDLWQRFGLLVQGL